jgi:hypothetical protein
VKNEFGSKMAFLVCGFTFPRPCSDVFNSETHRLSCSDLRFHVTGQCKAFLYRFTLRDGGMIAAAALAADRGDAQAHDGQTCTVSKPNVL